jgi:hypothetical protein
VDLISLIAAGALLAASVAVFIVYARGVRRGGGGLTVGVLGATHEMLSEDRRKAGETILNRNAGVQLEEDESGDPARRSACRGQVDQQ